MWNEGIALWFQKASTDQPRLFYNHQTITKKHHDWSNTKQSYTFQSTNSSHRTSTSSKKHNPISSPQSRIICSTKKRVWSHSRLGCMQVYWFKLVFTWLVMHGRMCWLPSIPVFCLQRWRKEEATAIDSGSGSDSGLIQIDCICIIKKECTYCEISFYVLSFRNNL